MPAKLPQAPDVSERAVPAKPIARSSLRVPGHVPTPERGTGHLAPWCARRTQRPPRAVRVREMFPYFPENRKKNPEWSFFSP